MQHQQRIDRREAERDIKIAAAKLQIWQQPQNSETFDPTAKFNVGTSSQCNLFNVPDANVSSVDSTAISANLNSHSVSAEITSANFMRDIKFSSAKFDTGVSNSLVTTVNQNVACCSNVKANICVSSNSGFQAQNEFVTSA